MARRKLTKVERQRTVLVTRMPGVTVVNRRVTCDCSQECYDSFDTKMGFTRRREVKTKYHITWSGNPCEYENEQITSVLCLPLISKGKSSHCGPDWTCIIAGFSSGFVRFYIENSSLLLSELLHNESVTHLKCQSFEPARFPTAEEHSEEVYVMYPSAVCVLTGFGLFQTLRACCNQLARVQTNCGRILKAPPPMYKKWGFTEQDRVVDSEVVGPAMNNTFDHLVTVSLCGDFSTSYHYSAPQTSLILATGKKPYVGFHYALEGEAPPVFAEVKKAVVSKVKSAFGQVVPGWIRGRGNNPVQKVNEISAIEPPVSMVCRFGLCDILRHGDRVVISPNRNLTMVSRQPGTSYLDSFLLQGYFNALCSEKTLRNISVTFLCPGPVFSNFLAECFTDKRGEKSGKPVEATDRRMTAERCGYLRAVAIANKVQETWMSLLPYISPCYIFLYYPTIGNYLLRIMGPKLFLKIQDSKMEMETKT